MRATGRLNTRYVELSRDNSCWAKDERRSDMTHRMARIRAFDPACESEIFLVIAYKKMCEIEAEFNRRRGELHLGSEIPLTNFRCIELRDFPAEIARLALIIAEFLCDVPYRGLKDALAEFLPLNAQNWMVCGNPLRLDWLSIFPTTGTGVPSVPCWLTKLILNPVSPLCGLAFAPGASQHLRHRLGQIPQRRACLAFDEHLGGHAGLQLDVADHSNCCQPAHQ